VISAGNSLADRGTTFADVIVVGAGAAGIAVVRRLANRVGKIILLDAGDRQFRPSDNDTFFRAERVDNDRHAPAELNRRRMLGGTTTVWGGRCIPFDPEDFEPTEGRQGWPIPYTEFSRHTGDALDFFDAGPDDFSAPRILPDKTRIITGTTKDLLLDRVERYSKPTNVWIKYQADLIRSATVQVIQGAPCTSVLTNPDGSQVTGVAVQTSPGQRHSLLAEIVVLACGGMETPRLLLASTSARSCGIGNEGDSVGRYYMTHLVSSAENAGLIRFANPASARAFDFMRATDGAYVRRMILLSPAARKREGLPNIAFRPSRPPMNNPSHQNAALSFTYLVRSLLIPEYTRSMTARLKSLDDLNILRHLQNTALHPFELIHFCGDLAIRRILASRKLPSIFLYQRNGLYPLEFNAEQLPNRESRLRLGTERDPLGLPRLVIEWRYDDREIDAISRAYRTLAAAVQESGLGKVDLGADVRASVQAAMVPQGGHHIGTARMGDEPTTSVVDRNCEVWQTRGLFLAGTAVLPTSGFANPTMTAVGLAFRLADHLIGLKNIEGVA
jgi:choline dehydrogenase-like flavoprotein